MKKESFIYFLLMALALISLAPAGAFARTPAGQNVIVLDPGHGGNDKGVKISGDLYEKDLTLAIAEFMKGDLENSGYIIKLTRSSGDATVAERIKIAADPQTDIFLSVHVNAGFGKTASGFELYFPGFQGSGNTKNDSGEIVKDMVKTRNLNECVRLSRLIISNMEKLFPRKDRELRGAPVRYQSITAPALIVEIGFATNPEERKMLASKDMPKKIAAALASGIREFLTTGEKNAP